MRYPVTLTTPLFDAFFQDILREGKLPQTKNGEARETTWHPHVDVIENEKAYLIQVELPGVASEDVELTLEKQVLTLKGSKSLPALDEGVTRHLHERASGTFERTFRFPSPVQGEGVEAAFHNGLLTITVSKTPEAQPRKIEIKTL